MREVFCTRLFNRMEIINIRVSAVFLSNFPILFQLSNNLFQEQIFSHIYLWLSVSGVFDLPTKQHMPIAFGL